MAFLERDVRRLDLWPDHCTRCTATGTTLVPVPEKYAGKVAGLAVPLCSAHATDWAVVRRRSMLASYAILLGMAAAAVLSWELQPLVAGPNNRTVAARLTATVVLGFGSAFPLGAAGLWWANMPIRVLQLVGRMVTFAGVSAGFARLVRAADEPVPLAAVPDDVRFGVSVYRPAGTTPPGAVWRLFAATGMAAVVLGTVVGVVGPALGELAVGWPPNDWQYYGLILAVAEAFFIPQFGVRESFTTRYGFLGVTVCTGLVLILVLLGRAIGATFAESLGIVLCGGALLLLAIPVTGRLVWRWQVRVVGAAVVAAAAGPALLALVTYLIAGLDGGPHRVMPHVAIVAGTVAAAWAFHAARTPACGRCNGWLVRRRIGALARTTAEVAPLLADGAIISLAGTEPYPQTAIPGDVELVVHSCAACAATGTVVVELFYAKAGGKNKNAVTLVRTGRWRYPGESLPVIEKLFPTPPVP